MYGAAVVKHWRYDRLRDMLEQRFENEFSQALAENPKCTAPDDESEAEPDDPNDSKDPNREPSRGK